VKALWRNRLNFLASADGLCWKAFVVLPPALAIGGLCGRARLAHPFSKLTLQCAPLPTGVSRVIFQFGAEIARVEHRE